MKYCLKYCIIMTCTVYYTIQNHVLRAGHMDRRVDNTVNLTIKTERCLPVYITDVSMWVVRNADPYNNKSETQIKVWDVKPHTSVVGG